MAPTNTPPPFNAETGVEKGISSAAAKDWALYSDWCSVTGRNPHETGWADLAVFLTDLPASELVQQRRLRAIRPRLGLGHGGLPRPVARVRPRVGPAWASYPEALAALRHEWWPDGVAARRDALLIVLIAHGMTRAHLARLHPSAVSVFPEFVVDDLVLPGHRDPTLCARCALTRWLQILHAYQDRSGRDIEELLTTARARARPRHDCLEDVGEGWRSVSRLLPAIDQHGALHLGPPITPRAVTGILARRFTTPPPTTAPKSAASQEGLGRRERVGVRPTREEQDEIGQLYEQIDRDADALNARIQALLDGPPG